MTAAIPFGRPLPFRRVRIRTTETARSTYPAVWPWQAFERGVGYAAATPAQKQQVQQLILNAAAAQGVDPLLALAIASHESGFNPNATNCGNANGTCDYGAMQINSTNLAAFGLTANPLDPAANVNAGVAMLKTLSTQYNGNESQILCAYQYGPSKCGDPSNLPPLTAGYQSYVDNWIAQNADTFGLTPATAPGSDTTDQAGAGLDFSSLSNSVDLFGFSIPFPLLLVGAALAVVLLLNATRP